VAVGYLRIMAGRQVVIHWTGQPMFSAGLIAAGFLLIVSAAIPERWMQKLTTVKRRQTKSRPCRTLCGVPHGSVSCLPQITDHCL
jgi:hypothetical protein